MFTQTYKQLNNLLESCKILVENQMPLKWLPHKKAGYNSLQQTKVEGFGAFD